MRFTQLGTLARRLSFSHDVKQRSVLRSRGALLRPGSSAVVRYFYSFASASAAAVRARRGTPLPLRLRLRLGSYPPPSGPKIRIFYHKFAT